MSDKMNPQLISNLPEMEQLSAADLRSVEALCALLARILSRLAQQQQSGTGEGQHER